MRTTLLIVAAGTIFVGAVAAGFAVGVILAQRTGASWWPVVGLLIGLLVGALSVAQQLRALVR